MKKVVWKNKSNNQLCVTIPRDSGLREGDAVEVKKSSIKRIAYSGVVGDLFHYGHLQSLQFAKSLADYNIAGVFTDEAVEEYRGKPICNYQERKAIFQSLNCVDRVMLQSTKDSTENLKKIHEEFPEAEIILVHGDDLEEVPGATYVKSVGGRTVKHPYYARLSNLKIMNELSERKGKLKDVTSFSSLIGQSSAEIKNKIIVSSKADTLKALEPLLTKSRIEPLYSFTISDWKNDRQEIIQKIKKQFSSPHASKIVIRSSAVIEDTLEKSMAGYFESVLNIDAADHAEIEKAITQVIGSYKEKSGESSFNQILVQRQTENIVISGVIFTRTLHTNGPYYVINYDDQTGSSDSVTSGKEHRCIYISHFSPKIPEKMKKILEAVQELEQLIPHLPLDLEFALTAENEVVLFQVRPLAANLHAENVHTEVQEKVFQLKEKFQQLAVKPEHLEGESTFFGDMPDWNPAEIIGDHPNHLDYSLYDYLITNSAWHEARTSQGYYNVKPAKLVELFGPKPYVNVRNTFNSFTPASISPTLRQKLLQFYFQKLRQNPHLQDKVEFEILFTCYDLDFNSRAEELQKAGFSIEEIEELRQSLQELTNKLLTEFPESIETDVKTVLSLEQFRSVIISKIKSEDHSAKELLNYAKVLLDECRKKGTMQFSRLARLAFIGKTLLKSLVHQNFLSPDQYDQFYNSISTVATKMSEDFRKLLQGELPKEKFLEAYGHLRPGTYDITSPRYDQNANLIGKTRITLAGEERKEKPTLLEEQREKITAALQQAGLPGNAKHLFSFVEKATEAREFSKFEFTKNLSEALELIAQAGEKMGFTRKEIALLDINDIFRINATADISETARQWKQLIREREKERSLHQRLVLPSLIFSPDDFDIIHPYQAKPNFITQKNIQSKVIYLNGIANQQVPDLENSIVVLENGDPGYDWIFTRNIAGLITKYGGVASHMSIRCAEFGLPAAIGCGELIFNQVKDAQSVLLDCKQNKIIPFGGVTL